MVQKEGINHMGNDKKNVIRAIIVSIICVF